MTSFIKIRGTKFADILGLSGTSLSQKVKGLRDDDTLYGGAGNDRIDGGKGSDQIYGNAGADKLKGGSGNDWIFGGAGSDDIDGGKGIDIAVYQGRFDQYKVSFKSNLKGTVKDLTSGRDGTDTLKDVEFLKFANGIYDVENDVFQFFNQAPTLAALPAISFNDTAAHDAFVDAAASVDATDPDGDTLTYAIVDGAANLSKAGYDTSKASGYGTLYLNSASGAYVFVPNAAEIEALKSATSTTFTLVVSDGEFTDSKTLTVLLNGVNDTAIIDGDTGGAVGEDGVLVTGGALTIGDADAGDDYFLTPASLAGTYGTFNFNATIGAWSYALDDAGAQVLGAGTVVHDTLTVTSSDGTASRTIDVTVTGANDAPAVRGPVQGVAAEDGALSTLNALANASDIDTGTTLNVVGVPASLPAGVSYNAVARAFTLNPANGAYQGLAQGQTTTVTVNYGVSDGLAITPATASWTVTGVNDAPTLGQIVPTGQQFGDNSLTLSGTMALADVDLADTHSVTFTELGSGYIGTFTPVVIDSTGSGQGSIALTYHLTLEEFMTAGGVAPDHQDYRVTVDDGNGGTVSQVVSIPLAQILSDGGDGGSSSNHNPVIYIDPAANDTATGLVVDDINHPNRQSIIGRLSFSDEETQQFHNVSAVGIINPGPEGILGSLFASILRDTNGDIRTTGGTDPDGFLAASPTGGVLSWSYQVAEDRIQWLGADEFRIDTFQITLQDGQGGFTTRNVAITIQGMNDAPRLGGDGVSSLYFNGSFSDQQSPFTPGAIQTHSFGFIDPDRSDHHTVSAVLDLNHSTVAPLSSFTVALTDETQHDGIGDIFGTVRWEYQLGDSALPYLVGHEGQQRVQTWNINIDDGHGGTIIPFVIGFNSAPTIPGHDPGLYLGQSYGNDPTPSAPVGFGQAGAFAFYDPDPNEQFTVSAPVLNDAKSTVAPATDFDVYLGNNDGFIHWEHVMWDSAAPYLPGKEGLVRQQVFDITIADSHGGVTTVPFTIEYNSAPVLNTPTFDFASVDPTAPQFLGATTTGTTTELKFDFSAVADGFLFQSFIIDGYLPFFDPDTNFHVANRTFSPQDSNSSSPVGNLWTDSLNVSDNGTSGQVHFQYGVQASFSPGDHFVDAFFVDVFDDRGGMASHLFKFDLMA